MAKFETPASSSTDRIETKPMMTTSSNENIIAETETQGQQAVPVRPSLETESSRDVKL